MLQSKQKLNLKYDNCQNGQNHQEYVETIFLYDFENSKEDKNIIEFKCINNRFKLTRIAENLLIYYTFEKNQI